LTVDKVYDYISDVLLPTITGQGNSQNKNVLSHYRITNFNHSTAWRWMRALGMRYNDRSKNYYVDGQKREDVVVSRNIFVKSYLRDEMRMYRWIQFSVQEAKEKGLDTESGYHYRSNTSEFFVEYHVDVNEITQKIGNSMRFGGNFSVRFPPHQKFY
jgi:hypothetical protein